MNSEVDSVVNRVLEKFVSRAKIGKEKYGQTLDRNDLTAKEWLTHLQEELMDATLYLEKLKQINGDDEKLSDSTIDGSQNTCLIS